jgi:hypothetical protein
MGWQRSSAELTAESQPAQLAGPDEILISSASNIGNLRDASEQRTTTFVTDIDEFFRDVDVRHDYLGVGLPASTRVEVRRLSIPT